MGDRANVAVQENGKRVYFYTHWQGSELPETVRVALARRQRWQDPPYLARIIFCEMVRGDLEAETGYGISTELQDNEYPVLVVDCDTQTMTIEADPHREHCAPKGAVTPLSFDLYASLPLADWKVFYRAAIEAA